MPSVKFQLSVQFHFIQEISRNKCVDNVDKVEKGWSFQSFQAKELWLKTLKHVDLHQKQKRHYPDPFKCTELL